ncbi:hypothetical protein ABVK25_007194 [Lepraria finkii]|uniref:Uncharacterized protein n=1 Tax=Lepraria finkii TaxID=1340010 RepID=A0ABR4B437_9LECA
MDGDGQGRRQYEQSNYPQGYSANFGGQDPTTPNVQNVRGASQGDGSDRFRRPHSLATQASTSAPLSVAAGSPQDLGSYGYVPGQQYTTPGMQGSAFPYQPEYAQESQRQRYPQYQSQMMYHPLQQAQQQSPYEPSAQYQPRQNAAEDLSSQFGVPHQYYNQGDVTNVSGATVMPQTYPTAAYQQSIQYNQPTSLGRSTLASSYPMMAQDFSQTANPEEPAEPEQEPDTRAELFATYHSALRETNENTFRSRLIEAGASLANLSEWLLTHAAGLGLSRDDQRLHAERIELWDNFNNCWLALLQRQKDDTRQMLDTGRPPTRPQSLLPVETLRKLGEDLIVHADELEKLGLVDYQMGVAEEEILEILGECIDLLERYPF